MTSPQDQYAEALRKNQKTVTDAVESWTRSASSALGTPPGGQGAGFDPGQVIEAVFDFAEQMLAVQREFAKTLASTAAAGGEAARRQMGSLVEAASDQAASDQAAAAGDAAHQEPAQASKATRPAAKTTARQPRARKS